MMLFLTESYYFYGLTNCIIFWGHSNITCFPVEGSIIVSLDVNSINVNDFPDVVYPDGIRIYHNSGDQTTFYFNSWADNQNIANNGKISFIISQADVFYYYMNGFDGVELGFDFYDSDGKIYGHSDCDYTYKIPFDSNVPTASDIVLCDFINISSVMTEVGTGPEENCCKHKLEIKFHSNIGQQPFYLIDQIITALNSEINVPNVGPVTLNADYHNVIVNGERINGIIVSDEFEICEETIINLHFEINGKICDKNITIDCDAPSDCCEVFYLDFVMPSVCPECSIPDMGFLSIRQSEEISGCEIIDVIFEIKEPNGSVFNLPFDLGTNFPNSGNLVSGGIFDFTACIENGVGNYTFTFTIITSQGNCVISDGVNVSNDSNGVPHGVVYWW